MKKPFWLWIAWFTLLLLIDFILPFTLLAGVASIKGSFLFWLIWAGVAVVSMFVMFMPWRENAALLEGDQT